MGLYKNKKVSYVAEIIAVIDIKYDGSANVRYTGAINDLSDLDLLKEEAREKLTSLGTEEVRKEQQGHAVFLLKELVTTSFNNDGAQLQRHNKEFNVSGYKCNNAEELAASLHQKNWSEVASG